MSLILSIETATDVCSVSVSEENSILSFRETAEQKSHATILTTFISECIKEAGTTLDKLDAVAVSKGPGSYTGLRIGVATAKGVTATHGGVPYPVRPAVSSATTVPI